MIQDARPRNTVAVYEPKQKEFRDFCERKQYQDADTVTEDKLLLFLVEEVADRPLRARSRKAAEDTLQEATRLAWRSVRSYTTVFEHPVQTPELSKANLRTHNQLRAIHGVKYHDSNAALFVDILDRIDCELIRLSQARSPTEN
ncbi:hypothetical protein AUP68_06510 [Ilyonectria robusta]